jgi:hypothetical protein
MSMVLRKRMDESVEGNSYFLSRNGKKQDRLLGDRRIGKALSAA